MQFINPIFNCSITPLRRCKIDHSKKKKQKHKKSESVGSFSTFKTRGKKKTELNLTLLFNYLADRLTPSRLPNNSQPVSQQTVNTTGKNLKNFSLLYFALSATQ